MLRRTILQNSIESNIKLPDIYSPDVPFPVPSIKKLSDIDITAAECAAFSLGIYNDVPPVPDGWTLILSNDDSSGFRGASFAKNLFTAKTVFLTVYRGTVFTFHDGMTNIMDDIRIAFEKIPLQHKAALEFIYKATEALAELYEKHMDLWKDIQFIFT